MSNPTKRRSSASRASRNKAHSKLVDTAATTAIPNNLPTSPTRPVSLPTKFTLICRTILRLILKLIVPIGTLVVAIYAARISESTDKSLEYQNQKQTQFGIQNSQWLVSQARYEEVRDILSAESSPLHALTFALRRSTSAMIISVNEVRTNDVKKTYPNARPIKDLVRQFLRSKRSNPRNSSTQIDSGAVGEELVKLLHKLGPPNQERTELSVWNIDHPICQNWAPEIRQLPAEAEAFDLRYLPLDFFVGAQFPFLFAKTGNPIIHFPKGSDFGSANFYSAQLKECSLKGAKLRSCDFRNANLSGVDFSDADLSKSNFTGALLENAKFDRAILKDAIFDRLAKANPSK